MKESASVFANGVAAGRQARAMSQLELAMSAGLSARTIQRIEAGSPPSLETVKALRAVLGDQIQCDPIAVTEPPKHDSLSVLMTRICWAILACAATVIAALDIVLPKNTGVFWLASGGYAVGAFDLSSLGPHRELTGGWLTSGAIAVAAVSALVAWHLGPSRNEPRRRIPRDVVRSVLGRMGDRLRSP